MILSKVHKPENAHVVKGSVRVTLPSLRNLPSSHSERMHSSPQFLVEIILARASEKGRYPDFVRFELSIDSCSQKMYESHEKKPIENRYTDSKVTGICSTLFP